MRSVIFLGCCLVAGIAAADDVTIEIAQLDRTTPVDFREEVLPLLRQNCLACHSKTKREAGLSLESAADILQGGDSGPAAEAGDGELSTLLLRASGQSDAIMPPKGNSVAARNLTPEELGLIQLWIDQGAKEDSASGNAIQWQPLPPGMNSIYAVSLSRDGQFAACGRANQVFLYHVPTGRMVGRLTDPALLESGVYTQPGVAHLDVVNALAFSPTGDLLASGGFQEIKIWRRPRNHVANAISIATDARLFAVAPNATQYAVVSPADHSVALLSADGSVERTLTGHPQAITALRYTQDGSRLVTACADQMLRVWNIEDGALFAQASAGQPMNAMTLVGGDTKVAIAGGDNAIRIYELPPGVDAPALAAVETWEGHSQGVTALEAANAEGTQVLSGSTDGTMRLWQLGSGQQRQFDHGGEVAAVAASPDGGRFASTGPSGVTKLWNTADGALVAELKGDLQADLAAREAQRSLSLAKARHTDRQNAVNAAKELVKSETEAKNKVAEEVAKAEKAREEKQQAATAATEAQTAADKLVTDAQTVVAQVSANRKLAADALATAQMAQAKATEAVSNAEAARAAAPDVAELQTAKQAAEAALAKSQEFAAALEQARVTAEQAVAAAENRVKPLAEDAAAKAKAAQEAAAAVQAAETVVQAAMKSLEAANGSLAKADAAVPVAEQATVQAEEQVKAAESAANSAQQAAAAKQQPLAALAFSSDGTLIAAGGADQVIHTWSAATGAPAETFTGHSGTIPGLRFAGEGKLVSLAANDPRLLVWDLFPAWNLERTIAGPENFSDRVLALDFSPDGTLLASGGGEPSRGGELKLWNVADGTLAKEIVDAHSDTVFSVRFSTDGNRIASGGADKFAKIFQVPSGELLRSFEGHTHHVLGIAWRADEKVIASASADGSIKIWDADNGDQLRTLTGFGKEVTSVEFVAESPDVIASSGDRTVRQFNTADGASPRSFSGGGDFMYAAAISRDGAMVLGGGQDSVLWVWKVASGEEMKKFAPPEVAPKVQAAP